jgi:hypothetical protein
MRQLLNFEYNFTSSDIDILISGISKVLFEPIRSTFLNIQIKLIKGLLRLFTLADVACRCHNFTLTFAFITSGLELLNKSGTQSSGFHNLALSFTFGTLLDIIRIISSCTSTMRTYCRSCILNFHVFAIVKIGK